MSATIPESHRHLLDAKVAALATLSSDGRPQLTAVWFLYEDERVKISLNPARRKVANLRANPACAVLIYDPETIYRYLEIRGEAEIEPDDDYAFADREGAKYDSDFRTIDGPGETRVVASISPRRVNAVDLTPYF
jgi:PPOX class probable F420-dependent enzyme